MFQDIIRLTIQKIFNDKILLGLLIVCLLGFFVGGFSNKDEAPISHRDMGNKEEVQKNKNISTVAPTPSAQTNTAQPNDNFATKVQLEPNLAIDFVKWWMKAAMDYSPQSAIQSHEAAINWMTPEASKSFLATFWTPELASQITSGATVGAFQPIAVVAEAVNPDHSIVVGLTGTLVLHGANQRPIANQVQIDLLVHKGDTGLRITGINNKISTSNSSVY